MPDNLIDRGAIAGLKRAVEWICNPRSLPIAVGGRVSLELLTYFFGRDSGLGMTSAATCESKALSTNEASGA